MASGAQRSPAVQRKPALCNDPGEIRPGVVHLAMGQAGVEKDLHLVEGFFWIVEFVDQRRLAHLNAQPGFFVHFSFQVVV